VGKGRMISERPWVKENREKKEKRGGGETLLHLEKGRKRKAASWRSESSKIKKKEGMTSLKGGVISGRWKKRVDAKEPFVGRGREKKGITGNRDEAFYKECTGKRV